MNPTEDTPKPPINLTLDNGKPEQLLTGQEWFDRFVALFKWPEQDPSEPVEAYVYKAARAAAGLDTQTPDYWANHTCEMTCSHIRPEDYPKQDDKQLREAFKGLYYLADNETQIRLVDIAIQQATAYLKAAQIQLVSELEGELPLKKMGVTFATGGFNEAIDYVTELLEHKKQELEGKTDV